MTSASRRLSSVAAALAVALTAASPAAASTTFLKLDKPINEIAAANANRGVTVHDFFWAPRGPVPFFVDMRGYLVMAGDDWDAGSPVENGLLGALVRSGSCQAGARYQGAQLMIADRIHRMRDVLVTGCRPTRSGQSEMMTIAFSKVD